MKEAETEGSYIESPKLVYSLPLQTRTELAFDYFDLGGPYTFLYSLRLSGYT